jgi:AraC-like DNA-binding protein
MAPRLRVLRHESELGAWELVRRAPSPKLRGYVVGYEGYVERSAPVQVLRQQVPVAQLPLIVNFGSRWAASETPDGRRELHDSFFAGLFDRSTYVVPDGAASCVQVNLTPPGAHLLFGLPMHEVVNRIVALDDVAPHALVGLDSRLEDQPDWASRFELLDDVFAARLSRVRMPAPDIAWAWTALERTHGRAPIGWICDRVGRSRRHLARRFREEIGLPPKTVARIMRFEHAVSLLGRRDAPLAEVAFECGYYDQAHMNRDFREFAGAPPALFAPRIVPDGGVVA